MTRFTPLSFRARLTLQWTLVFSCILAAASVWIFAGIRATTYADLDRHLRTLAGTEVTSAIDDPVTPPHLHELPVTALAGGTFTEKIVQILDQTGGIVARSPGLAQKTRLVDTDQLSAALAGEAPVRTIDVEGVPVRLVVLRTTAEGKPYAVAVGVVIVELLRGLDRVLWLLVLVWVASTGATAAAGFALASTALSPVQRITKRAMEIASTDVLARLEPSAAQDEIGLMTQSLNRLIERLHEALEANRRFAADAAHELRSPVTAIAGEIEVALRRERSAAEYKETLALVQGRLSSLSALITDLMVLVRAQEGGATIQARELPLESVVDASMAKFQGLAAARNVTLRRGGMEGLLTYGEPGLLGRVFDNVLENAIRYNREKGEVVLHSTFEDSTGNAWAPAVITIRIADTGPGIPSEERDRVFERFYRVDQSRNRHTGGAGLGLAIAREVLALFKGTIRVEKSSAQGTTVEIRLPGRRQRPEDGFAGAGAVA
jgi:two-component system OmpR family sensor kinase